MTKRDYTKLKLLHIATQCKNRREDKAHEPFCFEMFRRAVEDKNETAWRLLCDSYYGLVRFWVMQFSLPPTVDVDMLVLDAFSRFCENYTPQKLQKAKNKNKLPSVLSYLYECTKTTTLDSRRKAYAIINNVSFSEWAEEQTAEESPIESVMEAADLWAEVVAICKSPEEVKIAYLSFVSGLPPRDIVAVEREMFPTVAKVNRIKRNLVNRLRRNLGHDDDDELDIDEPDINNETDP